MATQPLAHVDPDKKKSDIQLTEEAAAHLAQHPPLNVMTALIDQLRAGQFAWFTEEETLTSVTLGDRMDALAARPDIRQIITSKLTGAKPKMAREWSADRQTEWIMQAVQSGDTTLAEAERAFDPKTLVVYLDAGRFWRLFRERMPWADNCPEHKHLVGTLIELLLAHKILTPLAIRSAINGRVWHTHIPMQLRIEIDDALLEREREASGMPYHAEDILCIVGPKELAEYVPLTEFQGIMDTAEAAMGFAISKEERKPLPSELNPHPTMAPPKPKEGDAAPAIEEDDSVENLDESDPDIAEALRGEEEEAPKTGTEPDGDATQAFHATELPRLESTVADGAFSAAIDRSSPSSRRGADLERSSSGGLSASTVTRVIPLLEALETAGFKFDAGLNLSAGTIDTLHTLLVKKEWPKTSIHHLRSAQTAFLRTRNPDGPNLEELQAKKDDALESAFFLTLTKTHQDLVRTLRASARQQQPRTPPPLKAGSK